VTSRPVEIATDGNVTCGVWLWRFRGRLRLTVAVKATFALAEGAVLVPAPPAEIEREDRTFERHPTRSVEAASDLAPYLPRCDVTFVGHAFSAGGKPASAARLAIFRDGRPLLDKTLHVFGDRDERGAPRPFTRMALTYERAYGGLGMEANPAGRETPNLVDPADPKRPVCFAPISRFWAARKRLLGTLDRRAVDAPLAELPESMPWGYFQAAPADQQIEHLRGGEWIVLDGLHPTLPRLQTQIGNMRAEARVSARSGVAPAAGLTPLELVADGLAIDGDRGRCSVVWRGCHELAGGEASLSEIAVLAGLGAPGKPIAWEKMAPAKQAMAGPPAASAEDTGEGTLTLQPAQHARAVQKAIAPFSIGAPGAAAASAAVSPEPNVAATPWGNAPLIPTQRDAVGESTLGVGDAAPQWAPAPPAPLASPLPGAPPPFVAPVPMEVRPVPPPSMVAPPVSTGVPLVSMDAPAVVTAGPAVSMGAPAAAPAAPRVSLAQAAPPQPALAQAAPPPPRSLAERLRSAGANSADIVALMAALNPPPPPPPDDD
jgi:hypothetical protein